MNFINISIRAATLALLASLTCLTLQIGFWLNRTASDVEYAALTFSGATQNAQHSLDRHLGDAATALSGVSDAAYNLAKPDGLLDTRLKDANTMLSGQLGFLNHSLFYRLGEFTASGDKIAASFESVANHTVQIEDQVSDALPLFLDCDHNADCLFNRYVGTSRAIERTAQAVERAAPQFVASVNRIADNSAQSTEVVKNYLVGTTQPKRWWERVGAFGAIAKAGYLTCRVLLNC